MNRTSKACGDAEGLRPIRSGHAPDGMLADDAQGPNSVHDDAREARGLRGFVVKVDWIVVTRPAAITRSLIGWYPEFDGVVDRTARGTRIRQSRRSRRWTHKVD